jgi:hypothetical protein
MLGDKTVTRRDYDDAYLARWQRAAETGAVQDAYDRSPRFKGKKIGEFVVLSARREPIQKMRDDPAYAESEWLKEGGHHHWPSVEMFLATPWTTKHGDPVRIEFRKIEKGVE